MKKEKGMEIPVKRLDGNWPLDANQFIRTDPLGMYTGIPEDRLETPVQDADDL
ncbi:MAG: hypothetical protein IJW94_02520 [Oscillospiraceae bacterium]|nr:hypothetical protein [Oscillospiraceae bacterium]